MQKGRAARGPAPGPDWTQTMVAASTSMSSARSELAGCSAYDEHYGRVVHAKPRLCHLLLAGGSGDCSWRRPRHTRARGAHECKQRAAASRTQHCPDDVLSGSAAATRSTKRPLSEAEGERSDATPTEPPARCAHSTSNDTRALQRKTPLRAFGAQRRRKPWRTVVCSGIGAQTASRRVAPITRP